MQDIVIQALSNMQRDIIFQGELREFNLEKDLQDIDNIFNLAIAKIQFMKISSSV